MSRRVPDSALCANCEQPYGVHEGDSCPGDSGTEWWPVYSGSWTPDSSKWWGANDLLVDGTIGGAIRLSVGVGGKSWLIAVDASGQSGVLAPTDKMADGHFKWRVQVNSPHHEQPEWDIVLTKNSTNKLMVSMDKWQTAGEFDVVAALADP